MTLAVDRAVKPQHKQTNKQTGEHARGKSVFSFWYIKCPKQSLKYLWHIGGFILTFILFLFYDDISARKI